MKFSMSVRSWKGERRSEERKGGRGREEEWNRERRAREGDGRDRGGRRMRGKGGKRRKELNWN